MAKGKTVYEVLYYSKNPAMAYSGAFGDGSSIARFLKRAAADAFAAKNDATVTVSENVPKRLTDRWSFMG